MKQKLLSKMLLVAALLVGGVSNAWGTPTYWQVNASTNVTANQTYVNTDYLTIVSKSAGTLAGYSYTYSDIGSEISKSIQIRSAAAPSAENPSGTDNDGSTRLVLTVKNEVNVAFYYRRQADNGASSNCTYTENNGKDLLIVNQNAPTTKLTGTMTTESDCTTSDTYGHIKKAFTLAAGTYTVYSLSTTIQLNAISYEEVVHEGKKVFVGTPGTPDAYGVVSSVTADAFDYESVPSAWVSQSGGAFSLGNKTYVANVNPGSAPESEPTYVNGKTLALTVSGTDWDYHYGRYTLDEAVSSGKLVFRADMYGSNSPTYIRFLDNTGAELLRLGFNNGKNDRYYQYVVNGGSATNSDMHTTYRSYHGFSIEDLVIDMATGAVSFTLDYINTNNSNKRAQVANTKNINIGTGKSIKYLELGSVVNGSQTVHYDNIYFYRTDRVYDYTINYTSGGNVIKTVNGRNFAGVTVNADESVTVSDITYTPTAQATTSKVLTTSAASNVLNVEVEASVPYTINYVYNEETISSEEGYAILGNTVDASITTSLWDEGGTTKYYVANSATTSFTVTSSGQTFIVDLRLANTSAVATLNAIDDDENILYSYTSTGGVEGEDVTLYYNYVVKYEGSYYKIVTNNYSFATTYGTTSTITYTKDDSIVSYEEVGTGGDDGSAYSGGRHWATSDKLAECSLPAGTYVADIRMTEKQGGNAGRQEGVFVGGAEVAATSGTSVQVYSLDFIVPTNNTNVYVRGKGTSNWSDKLDYVVIRKTADLPSTESIVVSSAGYATYVSNYNLDFTSATTKAYKVNVASKGEATLTEVSKVPAKTPVLLYVSGGNGEGEAIPVTTDAVSAVSGNDLVAGSNTTATDGVATIDDTYTNMILNNVDGIGFYFANGQTVATNRAYLHIATTLAPDAQQQSRLKMVFAGETTGVGAALKDKGQMINDKVVFNLNGQRVKKAAKGLYIVNGKKYVK